MPCLLKWASLGKARDLNVIDAIVEKKLSS